nr:putative integrase [Metallosphaera tengchongensis]
MVTIIQGVKVAREKTDYKYGNYIIRGIKGQYYMHELENVDSEVKEHYVNP